MTKPISRQQHGLIDYAYVPLVATVPRPARFTEQATAPQLSRMMSGAALVSALTARAEWGLIRVVPFRTHLLVDAAFGVFGLAAPWLFGLAKHERARNTFLLLGGLGVLASLLTRPDEMPATKTT